MTPFLHKCEPSLLSYLWYVTKKHFDIIIETAPNLNKITNLFSCFFSELILQTFWISNQPDARYIPYIFLKRFFHWNRFETKFFKWMGVRALSGLGKREHTCTPFHQKNFFETICNKKIDSAKSEGFLSRVRLIWNSKCLEFSKKAEKFDFGQIGSNFKCYMKMIFWVFKKWDSCAFHFFKLAKKNILAFWAFQSLQKIKFLFL